MESPSFSRELWVQTSSSFSMPRENDKDDSTKELTSRPSLSSSSYFDEGSIQSEFPDSFQQTHSRSLMERRNSMAESIESTKSRAVSIVSDVNVGEENKATDTLRVEPSTTKLDATQNEKERFYGWGDYSDDMSCSVHGSSQAKSVALHEDFPDKPRGDESVSLESTTSNINFSRPSIVDEFDPKRPWRKRPIEISIEEMKPLSEVASDADKDTLSKTSKADSRNLLQVDEPDIEPEKASNIASSISNSDITELDIARQALSTNQRSMNSFQRGISHFRPLDSSLHVDPIAFNESYFFPTNPQNITRRMKEPFLPGPSTRLNPNSAFWDNNGNDLLEDGNETSDDMRDSLTNKIRNRQTSMVEEETSKSQISLSSQSTDYDKDIHETGGAESERSDCTKKKSLFSRAETSQSKDLNPIEKDEKSDLFTIEIASTGLGSTQSIDQIVKRVPYENTNQTLLNEGDSGEDEGSNSSFDYDGDVEEEGAVDRHLQLKTSFSGSSMFISRAQLSIDDAPIRSEDEEEEQNKRKPRGRMRTRRRTTVSNRFSRIQSLSTRCCLGLPRYLKVIVAFVLFMCAIALLVYFTNKMIGRKQVDKDILPNPTIEPSLTPSYEPTLRPSTSKIVTHTENGTGNHFLLDGPPLSDVLSNNSMLPSLAPISSFELWPSANESEISLESSTKRETNIFSQLQAIPGHEMNARIGSLISFSGNGNFLAIRYQANSGHVRIFERDDKRWKQNGPAFLVNECVSDLSLSGDGRRMIVSTFNNTQSCRNMVKVLQFSNELSLWEPIGLFLEGILPEGGPVVISNDGSKIATVVIEYNNFGSSVLKVKVFEYLMGEWSSLGESLPLLHDMEVPGKIVLDLSSDGLCVAIANSSYDTGRGKVEVLSYQSNGNDSGWVHIGILEGESPKEEFGFSISLSSQGDMIAVGGIGGKTGSVNNAGFCAVYSNKDRNLDWDYVGSVMSGNIADERNGHSLSLSSDGSRLICGGANSSIAGERSGVARIYDYHGEDWQQVDDNFFLSEGAAFGSSVAMSNDGAFVAVGAPNFTTNGFENEGDVRIFGDLGRVKLLNEIETEW